MVKGLTKPLEDEFEAEENAGLEDETAGGSGLQGGGGTDPEDEPDGRLDEDSPEELEEEEEEELEGEEEEEEEDEDLSFLFEAELEKVEAKLAPVFKFRFTPLLTAYLLLFAFIGGVFGWLYLADDEVAGAAAKVQVFKFPLPPPAGETAPPPAEREDYMLGVSPPGAAPGTVQEAAPGTVQEAAPGTVQEAAPGSPDRRIAPEPGAAGEVSKTAEIQPPGSILPAEFLKTKREEIPAGPDPALLELTELGPLPIVAEDGRTSWQYYARPFDEADTRPWIAIVIKGLGLNNVATGTAIHHLPGSITLAFSPYANNLDHWLEESRARGHEFWLMLPMEPVNYPINDPGPFAMLTELDSGQNIERLKWVLSRVTGYVGLLGSMGSRFTMSGKDLKPVLEAIHSRGLMFMDNHVTSRSVAVKVADEIGLPRAVSDRQIDRVASREAIDRRLEEIEKIAREKGYAIALASPYPVTLERLAIWLPKLDRDGFAVMPVSALANKQTIR